MSIESNAGLRVPFGKRNNRLVAPMEVTERGLACECYCPGCDARLILRQGTKRRHFAHYNASASQRCVELSIHSAAIQVLLDHQYLRVPAKTVTVMGRARSGKTLELAQEMSPARFVRFDQCKPEVTMTGTDNRIIRPDVVGYRGDRQLLVEMCFTHAVDAEKKQKIALHGHPCIEIDLADLELDQGFEAVKKRVLEETAYKEWLYYPKEAEIRALLRMEIDLEIEALDAAYAKQQEQSRREREAEAARQERRRQTQEAVRRQRQESAKAEYKAYQQTSVQDREQQIQVALGIKGPWPYYLRLYNKHNYAIDAPFRLWQAAVFHRFIFKRQMIATIFTTTDVVQWFNDWFGDTPGSSRNAWTAIDAFLSYLKGCGFLKKFKTAEGKDTFSVLHNKLAPPDKEGTARAAISSAYRGSSDSGVEKHYGESVKWKSNWPDYETVYSAVIDRCDESRDAEVDMLDLMYDRRRELPTPFALALAMRTKELPLTAALEFLRENGFVE